MAIAFVLLNIIVILVAYLALDWKWKRRKLEKLASRIPGPSTLPIVGNSLKFFAVKDVQDVWKLALEEISKFGAVQRYWLGPLLAICVSDPHYISEILSSTLAIKKHPWYKIFSFMNTGVLTVNGKEWQDLRRPLNKFIHPKYIESCQDLFVAKAEQISRIIELKLGRGEFNIFDIVRFYALDLICTTQLGGDDVNEAEENLYDFHHHLEKGLNIAFQRAVKPQYYINEIFNLTKMGRDNEETSFKINSLSRHIIQYRIENLKLRGIDIKSDFEIECYTDLIIKKGVREGLNLKEMGVLICDIIVGGSDTTSISLAFAILYLAMHPEYQEEAYKEQWAMFGESDRPPTVAELHRMHFLGMVYKEVLRLQGIVGIARILEQDVELGEYILPEGAALFLVFYKVHRDPRYWDRPDEFYPYHFLPEKVAQRPRGCFVPFSGGPRGCPGNLYSNISAKTLLSILIRNYKFSTSLKYNELTFKYSLMLESASGYPVEITKRVV